VPKAAKIVRREWDDEKTLDVYEAVNSRRSVRAFSNEPVPTEVLQRILAAATRTPSSANLLPWHVYVVAGKPLAELKRRATARALAGEPGDEREYPMYPVDLISPYRDRASATHGCPRPPPDLNSHNYTSFRFAERLYDNGILPSMGSVGDSYDNALSATSAPTTTKPPGTCSRQPRPNPQWPPLPPPGSRQNRSIKAGETQPVHTGFSPYRRVTNLVFLRTDARCEVGR
jgi:hypothetical protein